MPSWSPTSSARAAPDSPARAAANATWRTVDWLGTSCPSGPGGCDASPDTASSVLEKEGRREGKGRAGRKEGAIRKKEREAMQKARKQQFRNAPEEQSYGSCLGWVSTLLWSEHRV